MIEQIFNCVDDSKYSELLEYLRHGGDANLVLKFHDNDFEGGETLIFHAVLGAQIEVLKLLITHGADVNYKIPEKYMSCDALAETPLSLPRQCRRFLDQEKYNPIVEILEMNGAEL